MKDIDKVSKIVLLRNKKILLLQTKEEKWQLPGGHLHQGETYNQGLKRELQEETNFRLIWSKLIEQKWNYALYIGFVDKSIPKLSREHKRFMWVSVRESFKLSLSAKTKNSLLSFIRKYPKY